MEYVCRYTKMEHWGKGAAMIRIVRNITLNDLGRFYRSIIFTILSDIVNFLGIFIVIIFLDKRIRSGPHHRQQKITKSFISLMR